MDEESSPEKNKLHKVIPENWRTHFSKENPFGFIIVCIILALLLLVFIATKKNKNTGPKPIPVVSSLSTSRDVPIYLSALGTVTPVTTVVVQTQINGIMMNVLFKEGQLVKKGQILAQIDKRPYEALLVQYEGDLKRDSALLANARIDLKRYQKLWKQDSVSQQTLATQQALVKQYEGNVETDTGLIQSTKVSLLYCDIISPIDGRIGLRLIDPGNFVQTTNTNGIAVITSSDPINVIFPIAEDYLPQVVSQYYEGKKLAVQAYDRQQEHVLAIGKLYALDNQVNTTTGTVRFKAVFNNEKNTLFPNQFVNIKMLVTTLHHATVVPTAAIQHSTTQDFVYLLKPDQTVAIQPVVLGPAVEDQTVIKSGLKVGQGVIVNGADKLMNGSKVIDAKTQNLDQKDKKVSVNSKLRRVT